jgi:hypothetical protein
LGKSARARPMSRHLAARNDPHARVCPSQAPHGRGRTTASRARAKGVAGARKPPPATPRPVRRGMDAPAKPPGTDAQASVPDRARHGMDRHGLQATSRRAGPTGSLVRPTDGTTGPPWRMLPMVRAAGRSSRAGQCGSREMLAGQCGSGTLAFHAHPGQLQCARASKEAQGSRCSPTTGTRPEASPRRP